MLLIELLRHGHRAYQVDMDELPDIEWAISVGMGPFVYYSIDNQSLEAISPEIHRSLQASYLMSVFSTQEQADALRDMLVQARGFGQPVCLLKGMSISHQYYPEPCLRLMRDIDLLLAPDDLRLFEELLFQQGYYQVSDNEPSFYQNHHHSMPFYHDERHVWVEVHRELFRERNWRSNMSVFSAENLEKEKVISSFSGQTVYRLGCELQLVYIAAHWIRDFQPEGGLFALWDASYLLREEDAFDWSKLLAWSGESKHLALLIYLLLSNLHRHRLVQLDEAWLKQLRRQTGRFSGLKCRVFNWILDSYYFRRGNYGRLLSRFVVGVMWEEVSSVSSLPYVLRLGRAVLFPPEQEQRYRLAWHWQRIRNFLAGTQSAE